MKTDTVILFANLLVSSNDKLNIILIELTDDTRRTRFISISIRDEVFDKIEKFGRGEKLVESYLSEERRNH